MPATGVGGDLAWGRTAAVVGHHHRVPKACPSSLARGRAADSTRPGRAYLADGGKRVSSVTFPSASADTAVSPAGLGLRLPACAHRGPARLRAPRGVVQAAEEGLTSESTGP